MKKKVLKAEPQGNGSLLTYADGSQEFLEGVTVKINDPGMDSKMELPAEDEEMLMASMRKP